MGLKTLIIVKVQVIIFYDGGNKFVSLLADMGKGREHIDIVWKLLKVVEILNC